ncbi:MAG: DMT family transporter [Chloroflexi bacterium]|nr:DMT family transporter [Chloroflexota bacterium]
MLWPYLMLAGSALFWAGNIITGRALRGEVPPFTLNFFRWAIALLVLLPFTYGQVQAQWSLVKAHSKLILSLGFTGIAAFQSCVYIAVQTTTAVNTILFLTLTPVVIVLLSWLTWGEKLSRPQHLGIILSFMGAVFLIIQGRLDNLLAFRFNPGDLWMLLAVLLWAIYSLLLRRRPAGLAQPVFLTSIIMAGLLFIIPVFLIALFNGATMRFSLPNLLGVAYIGLFPSVLAFLFWNRGVSEVGASKAGMFMHLMPVFGAALSFVFLGEGLALYHLGGAALVFGGIVLMSRGAAASPEKSATNFTN